MSNLIYKKMSEVMNEIGFIAKAQTNSAQGFKFRGIDQFVNALYPALVKHGVFMTPRTTSYTQELRDVTRSNGKAGTDKHVSILVEYDFWAEDGSKVTCGPIPAEGLDSGDKATNKALSAALKYALIQTFSVPTVDMAEADLDSPEIASGRTAKETPKAYPSTVTTIGTISRQTDSIATTTPTNTVRVNALLECRSDVVNSIPTVSTPIATSIATTQTLEPFKKTSSFSKKKKEAVESPVVVAQAVQTAPAQQNSEW